MPVLLDELNASRLADLELVKKDRVFTLQNRFTRSYYVLTNDLSETEDDVYLTPGLPLIGDVLLSAIAKSKKGKELGRVQNPITGQPAILWQIDVEFDSDLSLDDADESELPPDERAPKVSWGGELEDEVLARDAITGDPITTTAGERLIVTHQVVLPILTVRGYWRYPFDPDIILHYAGRTNLTSFYGAPTGTAFMLPMQSEEADIEGEKWDLVTFQVKFKMRDDPSSPGTFKSDTWKGEVLNQGNWYLDGSGKRVRATDDNEREIKVNLKLDGTRLEDSDPPTYVTFNRTTKAELNDLGLGPFA